MPKSKLDELRDKIGGWSLFLIVAIFILLTFFSVTTQWVPSVKKMNVTDALNRTIEIEGIFSYSIKNYVPKEKNFEYENSRIPEGSFEFEKALLIMFLVIVLFVTAMKKEKSREPLPYEVILKEAVKYMESQKEMRKISDYTIFEGGVLKYKQVDDGEKIPETWLLSAEAKTEEGGWEYRVLGLNPYTAKVEMDVKTLKEFAREDICPKCGAFPGLKVITPSGYTAWWDLFGSKVRR